MGFCDSFWATMAGALAGAVVGAAAAYFFGLDLARRDRASRKADDTARREAEQVARYEALIPMHAARVIEALHRYQDELSQRSGFVTTRPINSPSPTPRHTARAQLLAAVDVASVDARDADRRVFLAVRDAVREIPNWRAGAGEVARVTDALVAWQMFDGDEDVTVSDIEAVTRRIIEERERVREEEEREMREHEVKRAQSQASDRTL